MLRHLTFVVSKVLSFRHAKKTSKDVADTVLGIKPLCFDVTNKGKV